MKKTKNSASTKPMATSKINRSAKEPAPLSYEDAVQGLSEPRMTKVSVTVDRGLLSLVDHYVQAHQGLSRSEIFDKAIQMWAKETQKQADLGCYSDANAEKNKEKAAWSAIQSEAAKYIW